MGVLKRFLIAVGGLVALIIILGRIFDKKDNQISTPAAVVEQNQPPQQTKSLDQRGRVELADLNWKREGFGTVGIFKFVVSNTTQKTVKDIVVDCVYIAASGTKVDSGRKTIYDQFPPGKKTVRDFSMGFVHSQTKTAECRISDFTPV